MSETDQASTKRLLSASAVMASGTLVSRLLGFVRVILIAFILGNGTRQGDIYSLAMSVPSSLYFLFAGGALNTVLVPQIVRAIRNDSDGGEAYINRIITAFLLVLAGVTAVMVLATPVITWIYSSSEWHTPALQTQYSSMVMLAYLCMPQIFFHGAFLVLGQVLNAKDKFGPMMWVPIANSVVSISVFSLYLAIWGNDQDHSLPFTTPQTWWLGIGCTLGIAAQSALMLPFLKRAGVRYRPRFDLRNVGLGHTFHLAKWTLGFMAANQISLIVVQKLATSATASGGSGAGLIAYQNSYLLWILPHSLFTVSLATAMLPSASRLAAALKMDEVAEETMRTIRLATAALVPFAGAFLALGLPISKLIFGHGAGARDAHLVGWSLMGFALGLVPYTVQYVSLRTFYALEDTRTPFFIQVGIASLHALFAIALVVPFNAPNWVAPGLALANSIAYFIGVFISLRALARPLPRLQIGPIFEGIYRLSLAVAPGALVAGLIGWYADRYWGTIGLILALIVAGLIGLGGFYVFARLLHIREIDQLGRMIRGRFDRRSDTASAEFGDDSGNVKPDPMPANEDQDMSESSEEGPLTATDPTGHAIHVGLRLGNRFTLEDLIAERGELMTWRAFDETLSRPVLVHLLPPHDPRSANVLAAARKSAVAVDSRFLRVLDAVKSEDEAIGSYVVCEYSPGKTLDQILNEGPLTALESAWIVRQIAQALAVLHPGGLFHQRIDPKAIIITPSGNVKLSGFLIDAELMPDARADQSPQAGVGRDVTGLGKVLYACLTGVWPGSPGHGIPVAPTDGGRWLSPRQVRAGVSPSLDTVCDRVLSATPRGREERITSAKELDATLSLVLGDSDASVDLAARVRESMMSAPTMGDPNGMPPSIDVEEAEPAADTHSLIIARKPEKPRIWLWVLIVLVILSLVFSLLVVLVRGLGRETAESRGDNQSTKPGGSASAPVNPGEGLQIAGADDFDPKAEGGNDEENPQKLALAYDGKPDTAWETVTYRNRANLGGLKPGVGVVFDLGKEAEFQEVRLKLVGEPTDVKILVPQNSGDSAPMDKLADWRGIAEITNAPEDAGAKLDKPVKTRYLLVYLTRLPQVEPKRFRGGIAEIQVLP